MKIRKKLIVNTDPNKTTNIGDYVSFNGVILKCIKSYRLCDGCYFHDNENISCRATSNRCFNCGFPGRIFIEE